MTKALREGRRISGAEHAVLAACLSALVMILILLAPAIESVVWADQPSNYGATSALESDLTYHYSELWY